MRLRTLSILALLLLTALPAAAQSQTAPAKPDKPRTELEHIKVQHILIGFRGSVSGKDITRTRDEAKVLAYEVFEKAKAGADFDALVKEYTNDAYPGIYGIANSGAPSGPGEYPRGRMVAAFGDVGFKLAVGEIGIADWNPGKNAQNVAISPFGWHIIKRVE